jgi:hypothetical protein
VKKKPSIHNPRPGKTAPFIIGCNLHECKLCGQMGHRAEVHDSFKGRPGLKRKGHAQAEDQQRAVAKAVSSFYCLLSECNGHICPFLLYITLAVMLC